MEEKHVCDGLDHDGLTGSSRYSITRSCCEKAFMAWCDCLPDVGENYQNSKEDGNRSSTKYVGYGNNQNVCKAKSKHIRACEQ